MKVLIVDDSEINLKVAKRILESENYVVDTATSGFECLERVKESAYDFILMDIMMPEMDGIETFKKLKENVDFNTPVITLTAIDDIDSEEKFLKLGFDGYLSKPLNKEKLKELLMNIFHI